MNNSNKNTGENDHVPISVPSNSICNKIISLWSGFDKYFQLINQNNTHFFVKCLLCKGSSKQLTTSKKSSYNIRSHMKTLHQNMYNVFTTDVNQSKTISSRKRPASEYEYVVNKQPKLKDFIDNRKPMTKDRFEKLVVDTIVDAHLSSRVVENASFKALLDAGFYGFEIHRTTVSDRITKRYNTMIDEMVQMFEDIQYVCLTADCWTSYRRSFLGITAHWIDLNDFGRQSRTLACRRIKGSHKAEILAAKLDEVITSFQLSQKIVKVVTDNGSNFIKAFKLTESEDEQKVTDDDDVEFFEVTELFESASKSGLILPPHKRCAAHSANLTMGSDMKKQITNEAFKNMEEVALAKCTELFKKQSRSSLASDFIIAKLGKYFVTPSSTRWNYIVDAVRDLLKTIDEKPLQINSIFEYFKLTKLSQHEIIFLKEYVMVLGIVADALDILQGEKFMYMGLYSPTIIRMLHRLSELKGLKYCDCLVKELRVSINARFADIHEADNLKAALLHPFFKNFAFISGKQANSRLRNDLIDQLADELQESDDYKKYVSDFNSSTAKSTNDISKIKILNDFFFNDNNPFVRKSNSMLTPKQIINTYLVSNDETIESLRFHPLIKNLFVKYNTAIPSSAPCERLFSSAKHVLTPYRCKIKDENFESRLLLKTNNFKK